MARLTLPVPPSCSSSSLSYSFRSSLLVPFTSPRLRPNLRSRPCTRAPIFKASWEELAGVLVFSAIPFTAVKAIANSFLGERLRSRMEQTKETAAERADVFRNLAAKARESSFWYGNGRPRWLGPISYEYPVYLRGELPGDYGFDIAGLSKDPVAFEKYFKRDIVSVCNYYIGISSTYAKGEMGSLLGIFTRPSFYFPRKSVHVTVQTPLVGNFEILHSRWAMLGLLGAIIPELLDHFGFVQFVEPVWWRVGYAKLKGDTLDYLGIPGLHIAGSQGVIVIAICQALLMVGPEYARYCGIEALEPLGIYLPGDINYPGGFLFDPLGLSKDPVAFEDLKVKEIKNGRLAMFAWLGFSLQAALTGKGPIQNLLDHISDPLHNNVVSFLRSM